MCAVRYRSKSLSTGVADASLLAGWLAASSLSGWPPSWWFDDAGGGLLRPAAVPARACLAIVLFATPGVVLLVVVLVLSVFLRITCCVQVDTVRLEVRAARVNMLHANSRKCTLPPGAGGVALLP